MKLKHNRLLDEQTRWIQLKSNFNVWYKQQTTIVLWHYRSASVCAALVEWQLNACVFFCAISYSAAVVVSISVLHIDNTFEWIFCFCAQCDGSRSAVNVQLHIIRQSRCCWNGIWNIHKSTSLSMLMCNTIVCVLSYWQHPLIIWSICISLKRVHTRMTLLHHLCKDSWNLKSGWSRSALWIIVNKHSNFTSFFARDR